MDQFFTNINSSIVSSNRILYTPSSFARSSLLHLQEIGELHARRPHTSSRSNLASFLFFMVVDGAGELVYGGKTFPLTPGSCVFINCLEHYSHTTDEHNLWTLRWIHFYGPTLSSVYEKYKERGGRPVFVPSSLDPFTSLYTSLFHIASGSDYMRDMLINEQLATLERLLMAESWHPEDATGGAKKVKVNEVKEYLDQHYAEKITLDSLSATFYINKYYLTRVFKDQFGMSITTYLQNIRITHAKQMLRFTDKSVEEIGLACGLGSSHYFSQRFKETEGVPPSKYREQW